MIDRSRRNLIVRGAAATAGAAGMAAAAHLAKQFGLAPPVTSALYAPGETLTYASQRLLTRNVMAREFDRGEISKKPFANGKPPQDAEFRRLQAGGFAEWRVAVEGMVKRPLSLSVADLRRFPSSSQITHLACEEGWSFIAEWTGAPLHHVLKVAEISPRARYLIYYSIQPRWIGSMDMEDALHPQTLLTYGMNGGDLPVGHGGPVRVRVPRQLGYKNVKFVTRLVAAGSLEGYIRKNSYSWYAGI